MANNLSAKTNDNGALVMSRFPRVAFVEPVIGYLDLTSSLDFLAEESIAVTHAVAKAQDAFGGHRVEEAGGKTAQAAVAQAGVSLFGQDVVELDAHAAQALGDNIADTIVEQVIIEQGAKQELQREIVDLLLVALGVFGVGLRELLVCLLGDKLGERLVALRIGATGKVLTDFGGENAQVLVSELLRVFENFRHAFSPLCARLRWDFLFLLVLDALADAFAGVFERLRAAGLGGLGGI